MSDSISEEKFCQRVTRMRNMYAKKRETQQIPELQVLKKKVRNRNKKNAFDSCQGLTSRSLDSIYLPAVYFRL